ncbi:HAD family phosphatase [Putridiphycobacter roseus]|uniref:HAD family phosphatase n=1 Tax=Putridiphycobacter roseus TaxID=2219161 RepID=A0A2W1NI70_9FLAO|nr:HAD family phosphatase [Putridiphycobacter roseus]PZE18723.1 HAD family phosphatase [Putridiphycobacter roseus]
MNLNYDAIIFDLGGVILNIDYQKTTQAFKGLGVKNFDKLYSQSQQNGTFDKLETGKMGAEEFYKTLNKETGLELKHSEIETAWNAMLLDLPSHRIELLKKISKEIPIFLLSNTNEIHLKAFRKMIKDSFGEEHLLESTFSKTYYSHLIQARKPNRAAFDIIIHEQGLNPSKTLFIDDSLQHIEGAEKIGLQTVHLVGKDISEIFLS